MRTSIQPRTGSGHFVRQDKQGHVQLAWSRRADHANIVATFSDASQVCVFHAAFDLALQSLERAVPDGAMPAMCATCALGSLEPYSAPNGYDNWSCLREKQNHVYVNATDVCPAYTQHTARPRPPHRKRPAQ